MREKGGPDVRNAEPVHVTCGSCHTLSLSLTLRDAQCVGLDSRRDAERVYKVKKEKFLLNKGTSNEDEDVRRLRYTRPFEPNGCVLAVVEPEWSRQRVWWQPSASPRAPSLSTRHNPPARQAAIRQSGGNRRGAAWRQRARDCELVVAHALDRLVARLEELLSAAVQQLLEQLIRKLLDQPPRLGHAATL